MPPKGLDRPSSNQPQDRFNASKDSGSPQDYVESEIAEISRNMLTRLSRSIENDVIPRMMLALGNTASKEDTRPQSQVDFDAHVEELVHLVLNHDSRVAARYVTTLRSSGVGLTDIYLRVLAPSARRLGEMWDEDACTFTDVTIGVCRIQQVILEFSRCFDPEMSGSESLHSALIVPAPGEQHTFGTFLVMEFMRRAGWDCYSGTPSNQREFDALVDVQDFEVIAISISADRHVDATAQQISRIRKHSRNRDAFIMVGGRAISDDPGLVGRLGADGTASDGAEAARITSARLPGNSGKSAN